MEIKNNTTTTLTLDKVTGNKITIGKNAKVNLIGELTKNQELEIIVGEKSELRTYIIQKNGSLIQKNIAKEYAKIYSNFFYFGEGNVKITNQLEGNNSESYDIEIFAVKDASKLHIDSTLLHRGKNTSGTILVKGTVKDTATAKVDGMIKIEKNGAGANSFLTEHVMLLNAGARADTNPQLEIENNDVSSRHAASVTPIDDNKIFYMMARGISNEDARKLIVEGFLASALEKVDNEEVKLLVSEHIKAAI